MAARKNTPQEAPKAAETPEQEPATPQAAEPKEEKPLDIGGTLEATAKQLVICKTAIETIQQSGTGENWCQENVEALKGIRDAIGAVDRAKANVRA